ncbi:hypothetical protein BH10BDE1_BH10BDE1_21170 [soil metagenome]
MLDRIGLAAVVAILIQVGAPAKAASQTCEALFAPLTSVELEIFVDHNPQFLRGAMLSKSELDLIFKDVPRIGQYVGAAALEYLKTHTLARDSESMAQLWWELSTYAYAYTDGLFFSQLFVTTEGQFIFRGGAGETLFIDNDGKMYRTRTLELHRKRVWIANYAEMKPLN